MDPDQQTFANMEAVFGDIWLGVILESYLIFISSFEASLVAQWVEHPPAIQEMQEAWVQSLGQEDSLGEEMTTHSSLLAWERGRQDL